MERDRNCETLVHRALIDASGHRELLPDISITQAVWSPTYIASAEVPLYFVRGKAKYVTASAAVCNPIHRWWPILSGPRETEFEVAP